MGDVQKYSFNLISVWFQVSSILKLLLPALLPSWRFFDVIAPSPRIHYAVLDTPDGTVEDWLEFRPRPTYVCFVQMLRRMVWNPVWNESLFMVSCAERILEAPTQHSEDEILKRIIQELDREEGYIQFRLLVIQRVGDELKEEVVFHSRIDSVSAVSI